MRKIISIAAALTLLAACGSDVEPAAAGAAETATTVSGAAEAVAVSTTPVVATTVVSELAAKTPGGLATVLTEGLRYHAAGAPFRTKSGEIDVISPVDGDGHPTVVVFHGGPRFADKNWNRSDGQLIAEQGRVVFLPNWGHLESGVQSDTGTGALTVRQAECAVAYARSHTAEYGGDPDNITLYGYSAGASQILMAGLSEVDPVDGCLSSGPGGPVQALVPVDADWLLCGHGDAKYQADPEIFYSVSPWRLLDGSQDIPIRVVVAEIIVEPYTRSVGPDPAASWLSYRHRDIDLVADLDARGFLEDGEFNVRESGEYAVEILNESGYDASLIVMPGATHDKWGDEGMAVLVDTVVAAGET
ncbi:MAG: carboxylesterase family protein [Acidimicrobiia bacterium]|nr:carboxylesterase family protein [Acidimicrobiia bacterium]